MPDAAPVISATLSVSFIVLSLVNNSIMFD